MNLAFCFAAIYCVVLSMLLSAGVVLSSVAQRPIPLVWASLGAIALLALSILGLLYAWITRTPKSAPASEDLTHVDALTGLPNRRAFTEAVHEALARCANGERGALSVYALNLDDFKSVNERYGHLAGDRLLAAAATRLRSIVRDRDFVARIGGDEFGVLITYQRDGGTVSREVGERIVRTFHEPLVVEGTIHLVGASVGLASCEAGRATVEALFRDAEFALQRAKDGGRSRLVSFDGELERVASERAELVADLREALARDRGPRVSYQPIVDLEDGRCCGFEAQVGWDHPLRGELGAARIMEIAREGQLLATLGRRVVRDVCRQLAGWRDDGVLLDQLSIHVNVSPAETAYIDSCDAIENALRSYAIPGRTLVLRLTESALARDQMTAIFVSRLETLGVRICLDGFGSGYSSLRKLDEFRLDTLKIDRPFVASATEDPEKQSLLSGIVGLAEGLAAEVIAEGIETEEERDLLAHLGCRYAQGPHFGKPLGAAEARDLAYRATRRI
jgi:diguanylate cyclase (GGDEF)-like protein